MYGVHDDFLSLSSRDVRYAFEVDSFILFSLLGTWRFVLVRSFVVVTKLQMRRNP